MTTIRIRRGTAAQWAAANSVLAAGELGVETDTSLIKVGDGAARWNSLAYSNATTSPWLPTGSVFETFPREYFFVAPANLSGTGYTALGLTSGVVRLSGGRSSVVPKGKTIHSIRMHSGTISMVNGSHQWFCLVRQSDLSVLAVTQDGGAAAWPSGTPKELLMQADYTAPYDVAVYVGCCVVADATPNLLGLNSNSAPVAGLDYAIQVVPYLGGHSATTGLTSPVAPATVLGAPTVQKAPFYALGIGA